MQVWSEAQYLWVEYLEGKILNDGEYLIVTISI